MESKYGVNDVVYVVDQYKVIKSIIDSVMLVCDSKGEHLTYVVYPYAEKNEKPRKRSYVEAMLVEDLEIAKQSALANWRKINLDVTKQLENLTDKDFESQDDK